MLSRFAITGKPIGAPLALAAGDGTLVAAPVAANAAAWIAATTTTMLVDEAEGLRAIEGPAGRDLALPLTSRRWVTALGGRVIAPSGLACELPSGSRVVGGAIVLDVTATVVLSERAAGRELSVIALASGRPQLHVTFPAALVRVATRRGLVASIVEPGRVHVLDLRSGRSLGDCAIGKKTSRAPTPISRPSSPSPSSALPTSRRRARGPSRNRCVTCGNSAVAPPANVGISAGTAGPFARS